MSTSQRKIGFVIRVILWLIIFHLAYLHFQPLDRPNLTLYNHVVPGRLRFTWANSEEEQFFMVNESSLIRLIGDHSVARPKKDDEYRVLVLGSSEVWGYLNLPSETWPLVLDQQKLLSPDGRQIRVYNMAYVFGDIFKDLVILQALYDYTDPPDLIIYAANSYSFSPLNEVHWLASSNPQFVHEILDQYEPLEPAILEKTLAALAPYPQPRQAFWEQKSAVMRWFNSQVYAFGWAASNQDNILPEIIPQSLVEGLPTIDPYNNTRPQAFATLVQMAEAHQIPLLMISTPAYLNVPGYKTWLNEQATEHNIPLLDCMDSLPYYFFTDSLNHISSDGHRYVSKELASWLMEWFNSSEQSLITTCSPLDLG